MKRVELLLKININNECIPNHMFVYCRHFVTGDILNKIYKFKEIIYLNENRNRK